VDWIDRFLQYTAEVNAPQIFRLWAGIGAVSGALERRVWVGGKNNMRIYPNLMILLVGPPGSGKTQSTEPLKALWRATKELIMSPDSMTRASLLDDLEQGSRNWLHPKGLYDYHSLLIATDEISTLIPVYDIEIMGVISKLYDCPENYRESRRHVKKVTDISRPHLSFVAGAQPAFLGTLPEIAWGQGFASRLNMVYSGESIVSDLLGDDVLVDLTEENNKKFQTVLEPMKAMLKLYGRASWDEDAALEFRSLALSDIPPKPKHSKLEHYNRRRALNLAKLCLISAVSRSTGLTITMFDLDRAKEWLLHSESFMPDIFRAMKNKSDSQVLEELHLMAWDRYIKSNKPVPGITIWHFMKDRMPAEKIQRVLDTAVASGMFKKPVNENVYIPLPLDGPPQVE
jgi:energy-coupling factor transporter ATP-binding protein EcfA2